MSRVGLNGAFMMLVKAGRAPETAVRDLYDEASRNDGRLDLWCGDGKDPLPRDYLRDCLRFELGDNAIKVFGPIGLSSGRRLDKLSPYYVDTGQAAALVARLRPKPIPLPKPKPIPPSPKAKRTPKRKQKPEPRLNRKPRRLPRGPGRPKRVDPVKVKAEKQQRQLEGKKTSHAALAKHFRVSLDTIARALEASEKK